MLGRKQRKLIRRKRQENRAQGSPDGIKLAGRAVFWALGGSQRSQDLDILAASP